MGAIMSFKPGDQVVDLFGGLGQGVILDIYVNYHDSPVGETLAVCEFSGTHDDSDEMLTCDRSFDQISPDLSLAKAFEAPHR